MRSFASPVRHYLPDAPPMVLGPFFKSDCVEDDRRLQEWYFTHTDRLPIGCTGPQCPNDFGSRSRIDENERTSSAFAPTSQDSHLLVRIIQKAMLNDRSTLFPSSWDESAHS